jgi:F-type H+-transporting ATPase subunit epsilon
MRLKVLLPTNILIDREVRKVTAEAADGSFCLRPRHIDFVAGLVPGVLFFETPGGQEEFVGLDEGILVKAGEEVLVSTPRAIHGPELGTLGERINSDFKNLDERERKARSASARIEADLVRRFLELGHERA